MRLNFLSNFLNTGELIEVVKSYISILSNNQPTLELKGGNIDISYNSNEYIFRLEQLKFLGKVPATELTSEIDSELTLNGTLKLSGKDNYSNTDIYKNLTADFEIDTLYKSENSISSSNTTFDSEDLYLDLIGEFEITDDNLGRPKIISNLDEIQLLINKDNNGDDPKIDFRFKNSYPNNESLRINDKLVYEFIETGSANKANLNISGDFFNFYDFTINKTLNVINGDVFNLFDKNDFSFNASSEVEDNDIKFSFSENNEFYLENILEGLASNRGIENLDINLLPGTQENTISSTTDIKTEINGLTINVNPFRLYFSDKNAIKWKFEEVSDSSSANTYIQIYKYNESDFDQVATINKDPFLNKYTFNFSSDLNDFSYQEILNNKTITLVDVEGTKITAYANNQNGNLNPLAFVISKDLNESIDLKNELETLLGSNNVEIKTSSIIKSDLKISDEIINAEDFKILDSHITGTLDASSVKTIEGSLSDIRSIYSSIGITGLGDEKIILNDKDVDASELNKLDQLTTGLIDATSASKISGSESDIKRAKESEGIVLSKEIKGLSASFSINGIAAVNQELTLIEDSPDPDGTGELTYSWQTSSDNNIWVEVSTGNSYLVDSSDEGKSIRAVISYKDGQGVDEVVTTSSASIPFVNDGQASFSINGTAVVGNTLSINQDSDDPDGNGELTYGWQTSSDGGKFLAL